MTSVCQLKMFTFTEECLKKNPEKTAVIHPFSNKAHKEQGVLTV